MANVPQSGSAHTTLPPGLTVRKISLILRPAAPHAAVSGLPCRSGEVRS